MLPLLQVFPLLELGNLEFDLPFRPILPVSVIVSACFLLSTKNWRWVCFLETSGGGNDEWDGWMWDDLISIFLPFYFSCHTILHSDGWSSDGCFLTATVCNKNFATKTLHGVMELWNFVRCPFLGVIGMLWVG